MLIWAVLAGPENTQGHDSDSGPVYTQLVDTVSPPQGGWPVTESSEDLELSAGEFGFALA